MKQITSSIFNWQTMLVLGITVLVMYSKEISEWTKNLWNANKAMKVSAEVTKDFNEAKKEGHKKCFPRTCKRYDALFCNER